MASAKLLMRAVERGGEHQPAGLHHLGAAAHEEPDIGDMLDHFHGQHDVEPLAGIRQAPPRSWRGSRWRDPHCAAWACAAAMFFCRRIGADHRRAEPRQRLATGCRRRSRYRGCASPSRQSRLLRIAAEMPAGRVADIGQPDRIELVQHRHLAARVPPLAGEPRERDRPRRHRWSLFDCWMLAFPSRLNLRALPNECTPRHGERRYHITPPPDTASIICPKRMDRSCGCETPPVYTAFSPARGLQQLPMSHPTGSEVASGSAAECPGRTRVLYGVLRKGAASTEQRGSGPVAGPHHQIMPGFSPGPPAYSAFRPAGTRRRPDRRRGRTFRTPSDGSTACRHQNVGKTSPWQSSGRAAPTTSSRPSSRCWQRVTGEIERLCALYGYRRIQTPVFEDTALFPRTSGAGLGRRAEGDVHVHRPLRPLADAAAGGHGADLPRLRRARPAPRAAAGEALHDRARCTATARPGGAATASTGSSSVEAIGSDDPAIDAEMIQLYDTLLAPARRRRGTSSS